MASIDISLNAIESLCGLPITKACLRGVMIGAFVLRQIRFGMPRSEAQVPRYLSDSNIPVRRICSLERHAYLLSGRSYSRLAEEPPFIDNIFSVINVPNGASGGSCSVLVTSLPPDCQCLTPPPALHRYKGSKMDSRNHVLDHAKPNKRARSEAHLERRLVASP
jgi:hypothetical protein